MRSLTGLRRDSEVIFVGTYDAGGPGQRKKISDVFPENSSENGTIDLETDPSDHGYGGIKGGGYCGDSGFSEEFMLQEPASMLERKGFGSIAFRYLLSNFNLEITDRSILKNEYEFYF